MSPTMLFVALAGGVVLIVVAWWVALIHNAWRQFHG